MSNTKFTPGPHLAYCIEFPESSVVVNDTEHHADWSRTHTDGNIEFLYIQLSKAAAAPDMYEALKNAIHTIELLASELNYTSQRWQSEHLDPLQIALNKANPQQ